ncbi:LOW QUALITY PROTEIN: motile sperm domain-containing protein 2 [Cyprinus carpio]|uniref:LOW QUALITY PROTEIN: motile sperm domain-containing protein 2 n=1 Tax=Cyprinus carpio TaxID=7962 RepID=A0A9R0A613_CYPCA|nr:LOW QUALITY PROTEIN: motile sperm domain-containing protein 2 [Cyprinus carpio]
MRVPRLVLDTSEPKWASPFARFRESAVDSLLIGPPRRSGPDSALYQWRRQDRADGFDPEQMGSCFTIFTLSKRTSEAQDRREKHGRGFKKASMLETSQRAVDSQKMDVESVQFSFHGLRQKKEGNKPHDIVPSLMRNHLVQSESSTLKMPTTILDKKRYVGLLAGALAPNDMDFVKYIINCFKVYYPKFLSKNDHVRDASWIMNGTWKIVKTWLGPEAISKLKFVTKSDIQIYLNKEHLPPHMGGTDQFKYSYPPLPDDDFQSPICENGPIVQRKMRSDIKDIESESKETLESRFNFSNHSKPKKVNFLEDSQKSEDLDRGEPGRLRGARKPTTTFKGTLLDISPSEELRFGAKESERKCLIILNNVTKNHVAFKVRTTAPEKYRVKPSNSSCEPGASVDIVVSLHGGFQASPQDRFLVMAAEMESSAGAGVSELALFWKEVSKAKVMEHRLRCHLLESPKSILSNLSESPSATSNEHQDLQSTLMRVLATNSRLERKLGLVCVYARRSWLLMVSFLFWPSTTYSLWTS